MRCKKVFIFEVFVLMLILMINISSASIAIGNESYSINTDYSVSEILTGWINVSFSDASEDTLIEAFNSSMNLMDFLEANTINCYTSSRCSCFPSDCDGVYSTINVGSGYTSNSYSTDFLDTTLIGIKFSNVNITRIINFSFNVTTTSRTACINPLRIDLIDDGDIEYEVTELSLNEVCEIEYPYGCFNVSDSVESAFIDKQFCQTINIPSIKGLKIGAKVSGTGLAYFKMNVIVDGDEADCKITTSGGGAISCNVSLFEDLQNTNNATVCIAPDPDEDGAGGVESSYTIKMEDNETCGEISSTGAQKDFEIFARPLKYDPPSKIVIDRALAEERFGDEDYFDELIYGYIERKYGGNCNPECVVPINLITGINQVLTLENFYVDFEKDGGINSPDDEIRNFYDIEESSVLISSEYLVLNISEANLSVPSTAGNFNLSLDVGDINFRENITVRDTADIDRIVPSSAVYLVPETFIVVFMGSAPANLTYDWSFGDNSTASTNVPEVKHTYSNMGTFTLKVNISGDGWIKTKIMNVQVLNPYQAINQTINKYNQRLDVVLSKLNSLPGWIKDKVDTKAGIQDLRDSVGSLERTYISYPESYVEEHVNIMGDLRLLIIPERLDSEFIFNINGFIQNSERLDLSIIETELASSSFETGRDEDYYKAINVWQEENIDIKWDSKDYYLYFESGRKELMFTHVKLMLTPKDNIDDFYMVLEGDIDDIYFKTGEDYGENEIEGIGYSFDFEFETIGETRTIEFLYPETIEHLNAPIYYSPEFNRMNLETSETICNADGVCDKGQETWKNCRVDCMPWGWTFLFLGILLFVSLVLYVVLQEWYKKHYESHLFKNSNELFNLITFMSNGDTQKLSRGQIMRSLKPMNWSNEQLAYAWRKFKGHRTGMWEIPLLKPFENMKVRKEIAKRKQMLGGEATPSDDKPSDKPTDSKNPVPPR